MVIMSSDARGLGLNILQFTLSYLGDNLQFQLRKCTHGGRQEREGFDGVTVRRCSNIAETLAVTAEANPSPNQKIRPWIKSAG